MNRGMKLISIYSVLLITLFLGFVIIKIVCKMQSFDDINSIYTIYGSSLLVLSLICATFIIVHCKHKTHKLIK